MKAKEIEVGKCYTDKKRKSIRKVVFIGNDSIKYVLIAGRYKHRIGEESNWTLDRFAKWADKECETVQVHTLIENTTILSLKDMYTMEDVFIDADIYFDINDFNLEDFKQMKFINKSPYYDEYFCKAKDKNGDLQEFVFFYEEIEKYFNLVN